MSERYEGPVPPGHGDDHADPDRVPVCPVCGGGMRRRADDTGRSALACDLHGWRDPEWEEPYSAEWSGPEPDGIRYLGGGRWGATSR